MKRFALLALLLVAGCVTPNFDGIGGGSNPFKGEKELNVLIVEDRPRRGALPSDQVAIFTSAPIREYVRSKGGEILLAQPSDDLSKLPKFDKVFKARPDKLPYVAVGKGRSGFAGDLPQNTQDMLTLLQKYGGK